MFTLQDRDKFMLLEERNHFNGNQFYTGALKFAQVSRNYFGHYTLCACPIKSEADSDTFCSSNECEIMGFDFMHESESTCAQIERETLLIEPFRLLVCQASSIWNSGEDSRSV